MTYSYGEFELIGFPFHHNLKESIGLINLIFVYFSVPVKSTIWVRGAIFFSFFFFSFFSVFVNSFFS